MLLGIFAGVALLLAGVGVYGVTSYGVAQRTHEIGIRIALGASGERVLREVVGARRAAHDGRRRDRPGRRDRDGAPGDRGPLRRQADRPGALAGAAVVLALVSLAATFLPARRAARVDPVVALAEE